MYNPETGDTPLMMAIKTKKNSRPIMKYILKHPREVNIEDKNFKGDTCLMIATISGNLNVVKMLIEDYGADPNTKENKGYTPFMAACCNYDDCLDIMEYFRKLKNPRVNLHARCFDG